MKIQKTPLLPAAALMAAVICAPVLGLAAEDDATKPSSSDERFLQQEAAAGAAELKLAELAAKKAVREDVRSYAEKLVEDHTKTNAELADLARKKGVDLTPKATDKHAGTYRDLEATSEAGFDKKFLAAAVKSHRKCVKNFEKASTGADDSEVKAWAAKTLPTLQAHLEKAEELKSGPLSKSSSANDATPRDSSTSGGTTSPQN